MSSSPSAWQTILGGVTGRARKRFWQSRLVFICAQPPLIFYLEVFQPRWLLHYLVWMSFLTWLSSELPTEP